MRVRMIVLGLLLMGGAAACDESPVSLPEAAGVQVASSTMALSVGDQAPVAAQVVDQNGRVMQGQAVVYSTDNASVATVGTDGVVRGVGPGTANVSAAHGGSTATVRVTVTAATPRVTVPSAAMELVVSEVATVGAQVLDASGRVVPGAAPVFSSDNPSVATVGTTGVVRGVTPGTANITAAYGGGSATVRVTVTPDRRFDLQSLDVLADSVVADRRAGTQVVSVRATNGVGETMCPELALRSSDPSVATARMGGACRIEVVPSFTGETTITAEAQGRSDTFRVRVTSTGAIAFFSIRPTSAELVAGATVSYTVRVLDQANRPMANQLVNLDVSVGTLSATRVTTDSAGQATVQWTLPTDLRSWGQNQSISFRTTLSNGTVASRTETVFINGASLANVVVYRSTGSGFAPMSQTAITAPAYSYLSLGAAGVDQYGNVRVTDFTFALTGPWVGWSCGGGGGTRDSSGLEYTCFYSYQDAVVTWRATASTGETRTVQVTFQ